MRTPNYEDLSKEQDAICVLAKLDNATLVTGPPGTGKSVVAFYRAEAAAKSGQDPRLVMFSNVLYQFSNNGSKNDKVRQGMNTWHSWLGAWWKDVFKTRLPQLAPFEPDWDRIVLDALKLSTNELDRLKALALWGHLIVDEGQDFSPKFYLLARIILAHAASLKTKHFAITVLADENQRLDAVRNSSLKDIEQNLALPADRHFRLTRNYRNTYEIARMAAHFYCGLPSGIPQLPDGRRGNVPRIVKTESLGAAVDFVQRFVRNQSDLEIGVFLPTQALQKKFYNKLAFRLQDVDGVKVQRYSSGDFMYGDAAQLEFDRPGTVTVLCDQSCKGLEFDAVFIPELQARSWDPASLDYMRMQFYVLSSRARQHLCFLFSAPSADEVPLLKQFPSRDSELLEWING